MSDTKSYLFRTICQPTLLYDLGAVDLNNSMMKKKWKYAKCYNEKIMWYPQTFAPYTVITSIK